MIIFRLSEYSYTMSTLAPLQSTKKHIAKYMYMYI